MFTNLLITMAITIVALLAGLLVSSWRKAPDENLGASMGPLAVALMSAGLVALGFLVI